MKNFFRLITGAMLIHSMTSCCWLCVQIYNDYHFNRIRQSKA